MTDSTDSTIHLVGEFDAQVWAETFQKVVVDGGITIDSELMLGWFANAIMAGYDHARRPRIEPMEPFAFAYSAPDGSLTYDPEAGSIDLPGAVFQALGYASMCWSEVPTGIFESDRCREAGEVLIAFIEGRT